MNDVKASHKREESKRPSSNVDAITFEVIRNSLVAVSNEMAMVVAKSAYSPVVNEGRDFAGTVYNAKGELISQGEFDLPAFVGLQMLTVPHLIKVVGINNFREDEAYVVNDPYVCSTHCNDVHMIQPVFFQGQLIAFVSCTAHWTDVGGVSPGSLNGRAKSHFEEGIRIPPVRIVCKGELNHDVIALFMVNMRDAHERLGDINAQRSALVIGTQRVIAIAQKYGAKTLMDAMDDVLAWSETLCRASFKAIGNGSFYAEDFIDEDPGTGEKKTVRLTLTINDGFADFDLTKTDDKAVCAINSSIAATTSAVFIGLAGVLEKMPMNAGVMRVVKISTTPGSLIHALPPSPVSGCAATSMECVIAAVVKALSYAAPDLGSASPFSIINSVFSGADLTENNKEFISYVWQFGGLGASRDKDGASVVGSGYSASTQNIPVEILERRYPTFWRKLMFLNDSGGAGEHRGGLGCDMLCEFPAKNTVSCIGNREKNGPAGIFGGEMGQLSGLVLNKGVRGKEKNIGIFALNEVCNPGDKLSYWSSGGGGYGDPLLRSPEAVVEDIKDDYVTIESAKSKYGVVVKEIDRRKLEYQIDTAATEKLRAQMKAAREKQASTSPIVTRKRSGSHADSNTPKKVK